jgi:hypothetical protein
MAAALVLACSAWAHDIPNDVAVQMFVKPDPGVLHVLVRVPLVAMRDINFPERPDGYLDLARTPPLLAGAAKLWISDFMDFYENGTPLAKRPAIAATQLSLLSDRSFSSYQQAMAHLHGPPLPESTDVVWNQTLMDVQFDYPIHDQNARFSIDPKLGRLGLRVVTGLRFVTPSGAVRAFEFIGDPGMVHLDPRWYQAAGRFVVMGFEHILDGTDHLLFLFCLVIPFRKFRALFPIVTAFTVAHSITLIASAYNLAPGALWFPPLIETGIAASIVYMALENIAGQSTVHRRWIIAFCFGLVHGFGFSFALRQTMQFAGSHMLTSLLSFNFGVELGQLLVLLLMIPALDLFFRYAVAERMGTIILSALVAHTGWHWMMDRWDTFRRFNLEWPEWTPAFLVTVLHWAMAIVAVAGALWLVSALVARRRADEARQENSPAPQAAIE